MADYTKFKTEKLEELKKNYTKDIDYYTKKTEPNYKIKIPVGLKPEKKDIYFLSWTKNLHDTKDQYQFSISRFYKRHLNDRIHVVIYCNYRKDGSITRFECYSSKSDGSFWRYCVKDDVYERYEKGYNYITTTFINIYLQKFIDEQKDNFDIQISPDSEIKCNKTSELNKYLKKRIIDLNGCDNNIFFSLLNNIFPPVDYLSDYKSRITLLLKYLTKKIDENRINSNVFNENINICSDLFCFLNKNGVGKDIQSSGMESRRDFFKSVKKAFGDFFLKYFKIDAKTKNHIYDKFFNVGTINFCGQIYSVKIIYKNNNKQYILYYMEYFTISLASIGDIGINKIIIYIEPIIKSDHTPNNITVYGLDEIYVACGAFINKIFDYPKQTPITKLKYHHEVSTDDYRFIGDLTNYSFLP